MYKHWAIDATLSNNGMFCFVPVENFGTDQQTFVWGLNLLAKDPPDGGRVVLIFHPDGDEAVHLWMEEHKIDLDELQQRQVGLP